MDGVARFLRGEVGDVEIDPRLGIAGVFGVSNVVANQEVAGSEDV